MDSSASRSDASSVMSLRFSSMREGVTDLASTEEFRATVGVSGISCEGEDV